MFCKNCQKRNNIDARFCNYCGHSLQKESTTKKGDNNNDPLDSKVSDVGWQMNVSNDTDSEPVIIEKEQNSFKKNYAKSKFRWNRSFITPFRLILLFAIIISIFMIIRVISYPSNHFDVFMILTISWSLLGIWYFKKKRTKHIPQRFTFQGEVRGFKERSEARAQGFIKPGINITIWNFRLERYKEGQQLNPIPVEMRGHEFSGFINEGDIIKLFSNWKSGLYKTKKVFNVTNGSLVIAKKKGYSLGVRIYIYIVLMIFIAVFGFLIAALLS